MRLGANELERNIVMEVTWTGKSGTRYVYKAFGLETSWNDVPGNYIFARKNAAGKWVALYIGETGSLKDRLTPLSSHEKWPCAQRNGVTHIHARTNNSGAQARRNEEADLIALYNPTCNG